MNAYGPGSECSHLVDDRVIPDDPTNIVEDGRDKEIRVNCVSDTFERPIKKYGQK